MFPAFTIATPLHIATKPFSVSNIGSPLRRWDTLGRNRETRFCSYHGTGTYMGQQSQKHLFTTLRFSMLQQSRQSGVPMRPLSKSGACLQTGSKTTQEKVRCVKFVRLRVDGLRETQLCNAQFWRGATRDHSQPVKSAVFRED